MPMNEAHQPKEYTMTFTAPAKDFNTSGYCGTETGTEPEAINHPSHYHPDGIEAIDVIESWGLGFHLGNVVKYIARAGLKSNDELEDLKKARWYLNRYIDTKEN